MRFAVSVPNFGDYFNPRLLAQLAREAEESGWDGFFLWDHMIFWPGFSEPIVDPWVALAAMAMTTERIRLGTLVTPLARRRPWKLARETVSLDHLSGGRLVLGVGLGFPADAEFETFGEEPDDRVRAAKLDEGLDVLAGLWRGEPFTYSGEHFRIAEVTFRPTPVQTPRIPIWVAGMWPNRAPFRRAARWDGVAPVPLDPESGRMFSPSELSEIAGYVAAQRGSDAPFDVVYGGATPGESPSAAREAVAPYAAAGLTWWIENLNHWRGPFAAMRERLRRGPPR